MRALFGFRDAVCDFVSRFAEGVDFGNCQAIGFVDQNGTLEAGVVYHDWNPDTETIEMSAAATNKRWLTRGRFRLIFDYPFEQIGCQMVFAQTTPEHRAIRRGVKALGGREYEIPRMLGRDRSMVIVTLTAEQWAKFGVREYHEKP